MRSARPPQDRKFSCPKCEKKFFTPKDLRRHENTHLGLREHVCPSCHTRFGRKDHLTRHLKKSCSAIRNQQQHKHQQEHERQHEHQPQHHLLSQHMRQRPRQHQNHHQHHQHQQHQQQHQQQQQQQQLQQHMQLQQQQLQQQQTPLPPPPQTHTQPQALPQSQEHEQEQEQLHQSNDGYPIPVIQLQSGGGATIGPNHLFTNNQHQLPPTNGIGGHNNHHHQQNHGGGGHLLQPQPQHQVQFNRSTNGSMVGNGQSIASRLGNCQNMSQWAANSIYNTMAQQELGPGHVVGAGGEGIGGGYWSTSWMEDYQYSSTLATDYGS